MTGRQPRPRPRPRNAQPAPSAAPFVSHWAYGRHVVSLLLAERPAQVVRVLLQAPSTAREAARGEPAAPAQGSADLLARCQLLGLEARVVARAELDAACEGGVHQGVAAEVLPFAYAPFASLLEGAGAPLILVLDQIQDPQNFGALVRSAKAFGASGVLVPQDRAAPMSGAAIKASAGAAYLLPVARAVNLRRALDALAAAGVWRCGLSATASQTVRQIDWRPPSAVVVGAEGTGLRRLTSEACDHLARLPAPHMESLNAAVAGSLALYEAAAQRHEA